ncbi:MAG: TetR/AcrR family transcriptional regulator [Actinomycetota bacterium]
MESSPSDRATARRVGEQRPGGRAARVRRAVLDATSALLLEVGYDELAIDEVARRAGVHKTTVYRRWPSKPDLVADAVADTATAAIPVPDTGTLAGDLAELASSVAAAIATESAAHAARTRGIIAAAASSEQLAASVRAYWLDRLTVCAPIVERAIERGELPRRADPIVVIEAAVAPLWLRLLVTGEPIDADFVAAVAAVAAGGADRSGPPPQVSDPDGTPAASTDGPRAMRRGT